MDNPELLWRIAEYIPALVALVYLVERFLAHLRSINSDRREDLVLVKSLVERLLDRETQARRNAEGREL